jgi:serine/threonine protein phosphatase PrpC
LVLECYVVLLQTNIRRKSKETMRKAYLGARAKIRETQKADETSRAGSVSVLVINTEKLVTASMGNYRAVVSRNGVAHAIGSRDQKSSKRYWSRRLISGIEHFPISPYSRPITLMLLYDCHITWDDVTMKISI